MCKFYKLYICAVVGIIIESLMGLGIDSIVVHTIAGVNGRSIINTLLGFTIHS